jgi:hypothetical protein
VKVLRNNPARLYENNNRVGHLENLSSVTGGNARRHFSHLTAIGIYTGDAIFFLKWFFGLQADD